MKEVVISWFVDFPKDWATFLIAMIPVTELRVSIPLAIKTYHLPVFQAWYLSVLGTFCAMLFILFLLQPIADFLSNHFNFFRNFFRWLYCHTRKITVGKMKKYGEWAIFILAATPIPLIGGMAGALAAFVFGVKYKKAIPLLLLGTMMSGGIILLITMFF